jgi:hypothetical protein
MRDAAARSKLALAVVDGALTPMPVCSQAKDLIMSQWETSASAPNDTLPLVREMAKLIYDAVFRPGEEIDGFVMPSFEEAQIQELGGYNRAVEAAACVVLHKSPHAPR